MVTVDFLSIIVLFSLTASAIYLVVVSCPTKLCTNVIILGVFGLITWLLEIATSTLLINSFAV